VLASSGVLVQHPLSGEQQHEQAYRERGLNHDQWRQQQGHHLQRPSEDRQAGSRQPSRLPQQVERQSWMQVLGVRGALGVHRLQHDP
jgi:hypothetical protein